MNWYKDAVLEFVDELESGEEVALKVSHVEDVGAWVSAIGEYWKGLRGQCCLVIWWEGLELPAVAVLDRRAAWWFSGGTTGRGFIGVGFGWVNMVAF